MSKSSRKGNDSWKVKCLNVAVICSLIVVLFFQIITIIAFHPNSIVNVPQSILDVSWLNPVLIATVILIYVAVALYKVWRTAEKRLLIPAALGAIGTVTSLVIALTIRAAYADVIGIDGMVALTDWEWFWQQCSLVMVALVTSVVSIVRFVKAREKRLSQKESTYEDQFSTDESTLFTDSDKMASAVKKSGKKLSKKQRKAMQEKEENGN